jgi:hypothetical protein
MLRLYQNSNFQIRRFRHNTLLSTDLHQKNISHKAVSHIFFAEQKLMLRLSVVITKRKAKIWDENALMLCKSGKKCVNQKNSKIFYHYSLNRLLLKLERTFENEYECLAPVYFSLEIAKPINC